MMATLEVNNSLFVLLTRKLSSENKIFSFRLYNKERCNMKKTHLKENYERDDVTYGKAYAKGNVCENG